MTTAMRRSEAARGFVRRGGVLVMLIVLVGAAVMVNANDKTRPFTRLQSTTGGSGDGQPQQHPQQEELLERQQQRRRRRQQEAASGFNRKSREEKDMETQLFKPLTKTTARPQPFLCLTCLHFLWDGNYWQGLSSDVVGKYGRPACLPKTCPRLSGTVLLP